MSNFDYSLYYSNFHDDTERHAEDMAHSLAEVIKSHVASLEAVTTALDIGCGYGFALRALRNLGVNDLIGVEISPHQAERAIAAGFIVKVIENTAKWLQEHTDKFDLVLLLDVLEHQPPNRQIDLARAIYGSLTPEGMLLLTVPNANSPLASRWRYGDFTHYSSFTEHSLDFVLRNAGFEDIRIDKNKGFGYFPKRIDRRRSWGIYRKWVVRWCWLQVYKAELGWDAKQIENMSFDLNLTAVAVKHV